ncbi:peroxiredoxin-like 2C isoform X1 [Amblyraja radiata]|uniref:peroxiredoxin-like 2C isoform X1 n=1 Tax=Amblyraja radiata TaxID=386614 RepID=UPI00140213C2|nr:peroxiredoxin-like 2C isoform X1 [Amblyraja radiata]
MSTNLEKTLGAPQTVQIARSPQNQHDLPPIANIKAAKDCFVVNCYGRKIPFPALYEKTKTILVFLRHFLCYTCREYVEDLAKIPEKSLKDADVRLIVIGQSSHDHIQDFCTQTGYTHEIYVDPTRSIYKSLQMKQGEIFHQAVRSAHVKSSTLNGIFKSVWSAMKSPAFDFQGDPAQQGGAFIIGPGDKLHFGHLDLNRLDHAPINLLLQLAGVKTVDFTHKAKIIDI